MWQCFRRLDLKKSIRKYKGDGYSFELEVETPYCKKCGSPIYDKKMEQEINKNGDFIKTKLDNDNQIKNRDENINEKFEKVNIVKENAEKTSNEGKNEKILNSVNNNLEKDKILKDIKNENYKDIDEMKKLFKENDKELKTVLKLVKDHVEESWKNSSNQSQNIKEKISKEEKFSKISEFVLKNNGLENNEKKNEVLKTLIKLENSKLGIEPEMFKSIFSFYNKEDLKEINIDKNEEPIYDVTITVSDMKEML